MTLGLFQLSFVNVWCVYVEGFYRMGFFLAHQNYKYF